MAEIGEVGKILIVDDNEANVRLLDINLRSVGYTTEKAYDGLEALEKVRAAQPDLVLLDIMMPKLDGYEVCRRLRADDATSVIPVIMLTALQESEDRIRGLDSGADDFITKPFDKSELLARVKNLLRVKYYRSMAAERQKLDAVIEDISHGIVITDVNLRTTVVNRQATVLLGKAHELCLGRNLFELFEGFKVQPSPGDILQAPQRVVAIELEQENANPGVYLSGRLTRICDPTARMTNLAFVFRDASEERRKERLKRDFVALVSHKLKTPLTIVSGYLSLIAAGKYGQMSPEMSNAFTLVESRVQDLKTLIEKLLQYAGLSAEELRHDVRSVLLPETVERCLGRVMARYGQDHCQFELDLPADLPPVAADVEQLVLVLDNLVDNAIKFSPGTLARVRISARPVEGEAVEVAVQDFGQGVPMKHQSDIFSDFQQVDEWFTGNVRGLGLGLPTAKRLVESWGGRIRLESKEGQGSTFFFTVPIMAPHDDSCPLPRGGGPGHMETA